MVMVVRKVNSLLEGIRANPRMAGPHPDKKHLHLDLGYGHGAAPVPQTDMKVGRAESRVLFAGDAVGSRHPKSDEGRCMISVPCVDHGRAMTRKQRH